MPGRASETKLEPTIADKVRFLSSPGNFPHGPANVDVIETRMSWVFLAGNRVYKLKKPISDGILDLGNLDGRAENVEAEIRLNRRLAGDVYLGARSLRQTPEGAMSLDGTGEIVDWLVEMRRLPEERTLRSLILEARAERADVERVAETLVAFYAGLSAEKVPPEAVNTRYEQELARNAAVVCDPKFGLDVARVAAAQLRAEAVFDEARPILRQRISEGRFVEGNGDLRPEHIFMTEPLAIIDCLEFSKPLRTIDPFEEITCLGLEAAQLGADWVFPVLRDLTAEGLADRPPAVLLSFYWRYRALLRARFALLHLTHPVVRTAWKWRPLAQHYIALSEQAEYMVRLQPQEDQ